MTITTEHSSVLRSPQDGPLFQPGRIGRMTLRNRFVQAPIFTQFASTFGEVDDRLIEYHRARARGGVGLIIIENTSIDWEVGRTVGHPIRIDHDRFRAGLADLVEAVHNEGAKIAVQLHHTGRQNSQGNTERNEPPIAPTAGITSAFGTPPRAIEEDEIPGLIDRYVQGARRAVARRLRRRRTARCARLPVGAIPLPVHQSPHRRLGRPAGEPRPVRPGGGQGHPGGGGTGFPGAVPAQRRRALRGRSEP